jgi:hypothetical protein
MRLHVREHQPYAWFLLDDLDGGGEDCWLDVNCDMGAVGFSVLVRLSDEERARYRDAGRDYAGHLAAEISGAPDRYRDRDLTRTLGSAVTEAVARFRQAGPDED